MKFQNALNFMSDNESANRLKRRTNWHGSQKLSALTQGNCLSAKKGFPAKNKLLQALTKPDENREFLSKAAKKFFAELDRCFSLELANLYFLNKDFSSASIAQFYDPDYVLFKTDDSKQSLRYVSVLVGNKIFKVNSAEDYEISDLDKHGRLHYFIQDEFINEEAFHLNNLMPPLDEMDSLERLSGENLRKQNPELFSYIKELATTYPGPIKSVESEFLYLLMTKDDAKMLSENQSEHLVTDPAKYGYIDMPQNLDEYTAMLEQGRIGKSRIRFNLDDNGEVHTVNLLLTPSHEDLENMKKAKDQKSFLFLSLDARDKAISVN